MTHFTNNSSLAVAVFLSFCALLLSPYPLLAQTFLVSPSGLENVEGNVGNGAPFNSLNFDQPSMRYQQVYADSEFSGQTGPLIITEIAFRPQGDGTGFAFSTVLADVQINMSTTAAIPDNMSLLFSANVGVNDSVVVDRGPLALSSSYTGPIGGPKDFDLVIPFDTPFTYDPAVGNLLLDVRIFDAGNITTQFDAEILTGDGTSRAFTNSFGDVNSLVPDTRDSAGLVTRFTIIPEPAVLPLLALAGLFIRPRRQA